MTKAPARIRVAQDAEGFWTCREAISGSPEFVRADIVEELRAALDGLLEPFRDDPCHKDHHGYCQAHFLEEECCVAVARVALSRLAEVSNG